jgi:hypothetical protein
MNVPLIGGATAIPGDSQPPGFSTCACGRQRQSDRSQRFLIHDHTDLAAQQIK